MLRLVKVVLFISVITSSMILPMKEVPVEQNSQVSAPQTLQVPAVAQRMSQADIDAVLNRANEAIAAMPEMLNRIPNILQGIENRERERQAAEHQRNVDAVMNQNTILISTPLWPIDYYQEGRQRTNFWGDHYFQAGGWRRAYIPRLALFKRDLISASMYLVNMISDVAMYKMIKRVRVQRIKEYMMEHDQEVINLLSHLKNELLKIDYKLEDKKITQKEAGIQKKKALALLKKFADMEHALKSAFFNKEIMAIILGRLAIEKVSDSFEKAFIFNRVPAQFMQMDTMLLVPPFMQASFDNNGTGQRNVSPDYPISIFTLLRTINAILFNSPDLYRIVLGDLLDTTADELNWANTLFDLGIPKFIFNPKFKMLTHFAGQVASLVFAVKAFDARSHAYWISYLEKKHDDLLIIMQEYKTLKNSVALADAKRLQEVEDRLESFIAEGQEYAWMPGSYYKAWLKSKNAGSAKVDTYYSYALFGLFAIKAYTAYRFFTAPAAQDGMPA